MDRIRAERRAAPGRAPIGCRLFPQNQWRAGALQGRTPDEAFFVVCDETNNTDGADKVVIDIGIAPVRPAEFLTFAITQTTSTKA
ncbi:hypothetical protein [Streptomyces sp. NPDC053069]|uniref:hypothetical protein n=1 Tax=Streptomyces sp. NPDC053069 TaxID=3365695 RepID=UPI0037D4FD9F